jgi:hypothetical protein
VVGGLWGWVCRHAPRRRQHRCCGNVSTRALRRRSLQRRRRLLAAPARLCGTALLQASARWRPKCAHAALPRISGWERRRLLAGGSALPLNRHGTQCRSAPQAARPSGAQPAPRQVGAGQLDGLSVRPPAVGPCGGPPALPRQVVRVVWHGRASSSGRRARLTVAGAQILLRMLSAAAAAAPRGQCGRAAASRRRARRRRRMCG